MKISQHRKRNRSIVLTIMLFVFIAAFSLLLSSCGGGGSGTGTGAAGITCADLSSEGYIPPAESVADESNNHMEITNSDSELGQAYTCSDSLVFHSPGSQSGAVSQNADRKGRWKNGFSLRLWAQASPPKIVGKAAGVPWNMPMNDLTSGGRYTGTQHDPPYVYYRVEIDSIGPDTFRWSDDNGSTWQASNVTITPGTAQNLNRGVTVKFVTDASHRIGDFWNITAGILQATSVSIKGSKVIVSYSMIGGSYLGAVRVYKNYFGFPFLRSQALLRDTDVNAVSVSGNKVYTVGASEPASPPHASILEVIGLAGSRLVLSGNSRLVLNSYAGTSVIHDSGNSKLYATSGNGGDLAVIDDFSLIIDNQFALDDARWVHFEDNTSTLVVAQGCCGSSANGQISVYDMNSGSPTLQNSFGFNGADIAGSKTTVEVVGGKAVIASGSGGVQVMSTVTGSVLASLPIPTAAESGISDPNLRVANAVSVDDDLMFISFGEAGVYVAQADEDLDDSGSEGPVTLTMLGKLQFGSLQSVNHVAFKGNYLYVAAGLGGLKIARIKAP